MTYDTLRMQLTGAAPAATPRTRGKAVAVPRRARRAYLPRRGRLVLDNREGAIIVVESGCLWITLEDDPRDIILVKGMRFEIDRTGRTIVTAEEDSRFRLLASETRLERTFAWLERWAARMRSRAVPYY